MMLCLGCFKREATEEKCICGFCPDSPRHFSLLPLGIQLHQGRYTIGRLLGRPGGFGIAYLGYDHNAQRRVAIKEFFPTTLVSRGTDHVTVVPQSDYYGKLFEHGLDRFLEEARQLKLFRHYNIIRVQECFEEMGTVYLVMEYRSGQTLAQYIQRQGGKMKEKVAVPLMMQIMDGLREVHKKRIIHRDIKPENIYLAKNSAGNSFPILLDFGAARVAIGEKDQELTRIFTPDFAPFEQWTTTQKQGPWTDIYSCGATLYFAVTGEKPPRAPDRQEKDTLVAPEKLEPSISPEFSKTLTCALSLRPEDRFQTIEEFQQQFLKKEVEIAIPSPIPEGEGNSDPSTLVEPKHKEEKRFNWVVVLLLIGCLIGALIIGKN